MTLARIGHQPEGAAGAELQVRYLHVPVDAADDQSFFASVELKGFAQFKLQGHKSMRYFACTSAPVVDKIGDAAVATLVVVSLNLGKQLFGGKPALFETVAVGCERLFQCGVEGGEFAEPFASAVARWLYLLGTAQPSGYGVVR